MITLMLSLLMMRPASNASVVDSQDNTNELTDNSNDNSVSNDNENIHLFDRQDCVHENETTSEHT